MQVSASGSMSTVSREDNLAFSSEDSSSPGYESELELGLGLSLGGADRHGSRPLRCSRILTAKDFPASSSSSVSGSGSGPGSSSSSSSSLSRASVTAGTKRSADSVAGANGSGSGPVVGWPPIRAYRMNSMVIHSKSPSAEALSLMEEEENRGAGDAIRKAENGDEKLKGNAKENGRVGRTLFVKVNMDGIPIGRKVDLSSHMGYEALARTLEDMFNEPNALVKLRLSGKDGPSKLLDGSSDNVLTYEDKEGDWMLVGDVPWGMFLRSVKRLRIMRTSEANGLSPRLQERNGRQRCQRI